MARPIVVAATLTPSEVEALKWAAEKAEWFGAVTGDRASEEYHKSMMNDVERALLKLGIMIHRAS